MTGDRLLEFAASASSSTTRRQVPCGPSRRLARGRAGECLAVVGESGSGKSRCFSPASGCSRTNGRARGSARFLGEELLGATERDAQHACAALACRWSSQDPMNTLTPHLRIERQLTEGAARPRPAERGEARQRALAGAAHGRHRRNPKRGCGQYPHELSGGHAPARRDRRGADGAPAAADRRRADHGARRHRAGAGAGAAARGAGRGASPS